MATTDPLVIGLLTEMEASVQNAHNPHARDNVVYSVKAIIALMVDRIPENERPALIERIKIAVSPDILREHTIDKWLMTESDRKTAATIRAIKKDTGLADDSKEMLTRMYNKFVEADSAMIVPE